MIKRPAKFVLSIFAALFFLVPAVGVAQNTAPPLAEMWLVTPKADHGSDFYEALKKHTAFREEHEDPRSWQVYTPMLGDKLNQYAIRYCCFSWADQDSYDAWGDEAKKISAHFQEHVAPHVESWEHYFESIDWKNSHWVAENGPYKMFAVTEFNLKPGEARNFNAAREKMSQIALNQGWATKDRSWLWATTIGGKQQQSVIIPLRKFADLDRDGDTFVRFLSKHMTATAVEDLMQQFNGASWNTNYQIWKLQDDLSMGEAD